MRAKHLVVGCIEVWSTCTLYSELEVPVLFLIWCILEPCSSILIARGPTLCGLLEDTNLSVPFQIPAALLIMDFSTPISVNPLEMPKLWVSGIQLASCSLSFVPSPRTWSCLLWAGRSAKVRDASLRCQAQHSGNVHGMGPFPCALCSFSHVFL